MHHTFCSLSDLPCQINELVEIASHFPLRFWIVILNHQGLFELRCTSRLKILCLCRWEWGLIRIQIRQQMLSRLPKCIKSKPFSYNNRKKVQQQQMMTIRVSTSIFLHIPLLCAFRWKSMKSSPMSYMLVRLRSISSMLVFNWLVINSHHMTLVSLKSCIVNQYECCLGITCTCCLLLYRIEIYTGSIPQNTSEAWDMPFEIEIVRIVSTSDNNVLCMLRM